MKTPRDFEQWWETYCANTPDNAYCPQVDNHILKEIARHAWNGGIECCQKIFEEDAAEYYSARFGSVYANDPRLPLAT